MSEREGDRDIYICQIYGDDRNHGTGWTGKSSERHRPLASTIHKHASVKKKAKQTVKFNKQSVNYTAVSQRST